MFRQNLPDIPEIADQKSWKRGGQEDPHIGTQPPYASGTPNGATALRRCQTTQSWCDSSSFKDPQWVPPALHLRGGVVARRGRMSPIQSTYAPHTSGWGYHLLVGRICAPCLSTSGMGFYSLVPQPPGLLTWALPLFGFPLFHWYGSALDLPFVSVR